ncbi:MAG: helix-turn-helix transcriptional regulator [Erysipelotrichaceae bacterium]|nr:helix-turn-helix transcriptional regulator [Erysipelotrichaceae bacterium]
MSFGDLLRERQLSVSALSRISNVSAALISDLSRGQTSLFEVSGQDLYGLSQALGMTIEQLLQCERLLRPRFENFKKDCKKRLRVLGDHDFITDVIESQDINFFFSHKWYPETFYLLALLDLVCQRNGVLLYPDYKDLRTMRLSQTIYPDEVVILASSVSSERPLQEALKHAMPQFLRYNIVETDISE